MVGGLVFRKGQPTNVTTRLKGARIYKAQVNRPAIVSLSITDLSDQRRQRLTIATRMIARRSRPAANLGCRSSSIAGKPSSSGRLRRLFPGVKTYTRTTRQRAIDSRLLPNGVATIPSPADVCYRISLTKLTSEIEEKIRRGAFVNFSTSCYELSATCCTTRRDGLSQCRVAYLFPEIDSQWTVRRERCVSVS